MVETFHPLEIRPGINVSMNSEIQQHIAASGAPGNGHPSGTARIGPADMTLHGVKGLSVADCSVFPLIRGTHTSSTTYAVPEKLSSPPLF
jgi:choline dehydrogenase-like flavoprotein